MDSSSGHSRRRLGSDQGSRPRSPREVQEDGNPGGERIVQRFFPEPEAEIPPLAAADGGRKGARGEREEGSKGGGAEKGHRPRQETGSGAGRRTQAHALARAVFALHGKAG